MASNSRRFHDARQNKWLFCAGVFIAALLLTYWPDGLMHFRYERSALAACEVWRILSAHLVHLNTTHLLLNLLGLFLICELLWADLPIAHGLGLLVFTAAGVSALLWYCNPDVRWYAGSSGILHGLWTGCALATWQSRVGLAGLGLLLVKLSVEWRYGASLRLEQMIGADVVTVAHFYGAIMGGVYLFLWKLGIFWRRKRCCE